MNKVSILIYLFNSTFGGNRRSGRSEWVICMFCVCPQWKKVSGFAILHMSRVKRVTKLFGIVFWRVSAMKRVTQLLEGIWFCICHEWKGSRGWSGSFFGVCPQWKGSLSLWGEAVCQQTLGENTIAYIFNSDSCKKLTPIAFRRQEYQILSKIGKIDGIYMNKVSVLSYLFSATFWGNRRSGRS